MALPALNKIKEGVAKYFEEIRAVRRHIHQHPELSFQETNTSAYIQEKLKQAGIPFSNGHVKTGIVATLTGKNPGKRTLLLRADMDALPILEKNEVSYASKNKGVMHACGHDVHSACALGAAYILNDLKNEWEGTIKIMFQPGEEVLPGGASLMIADGVLENPKVDRAIALHVFPGMEAGKVGFKSGMYMASTDELYITVNGKGGHAAMPADYVNPLLIASELLLRINQRFTDPDSLRELGGEGIPTVVAFGKIEGKGATNVIPDQVTIEGTFRTMNEAWREKVHKELREIVMSFSRKYQFDSFIRIERGYPFLVNDPDVTSVCRKAAESYLGVARVEELPLRMTAEDFAFISQEVPSCFFRLGTSSASGEFRAGVHTATFDIDENALQTGMGLMAWLAINNLQD